MDEISLETLDGLFDETPAVQPLPVIIASKLNGNTVYTHCPPGITLEQAKAAYLPKGAEVPRVMAEEEVAAVFPEE